jgi:hypothetical protein
MQFDMGLGGLGLLAVISLGFGVGAQLIVGRDHTRWMWLIGAVAWFAGGLFASEVVWGGLTEAELQPIIDGLAFDESLLGGVIVGVAAVIATWYATRRSHHLSGPMAS